MKGRRRRRLPELDTFAAIEGPHFIQRGLIKDAAVEHSIPQIPIVDGELEQLRADQVGDVSKDHVHAIKRGFETGQAAAWIFEHPGAACGWISQ